MVVATQPGKLRAAAIAFGHRICQLKSLRTDAARIEFRHAQPNWDVRFRDVSHRGALRMQRDVITKIRQRVG